MSVFNFTKATLTSLFIIASFTAGASDVLSLFDKDEVLIAAHRGCWKGSSENSLDAIEKCISLGVSIVELDVRKTKDNVLILMHDETVDRTTNGKGAVEDLTWAEISRLRLKAENGVSGEITERSVPTFVAAIKAAKDRIIVNVDAKADLYAEVFNELSKLSMVGQALLKKPVLANDAPLTQDRSFKGSIVMPIISQFEGDAKTIIEPQLAKPPKAMEVWFSDLDYLKQSAELAAEKGVLVWVNALDVAAGLSAHYVDSKALKDNGETWQDLIDAGTDIIQTDEPEQLAIFLQYNKRKL